MASAHKRQDLRAVLAPRDDPLPHLEQLAATLEKKRQVVGTLEMCGGVSLPKDELLPNGEVTRDGMPRGVGPEGVTDRRRAVLAEDLEHASGEVDVNAVPLVIDGSLPHDDASGVSRPRMRQPPAGIGHATTGREVGTPKARVE